MEQYDLDEFSATGVLVRHPMFAACERNAGTNTQHTRFAYSLYRSCQCFHVGVVSVQIRTRGSYRVRSTIDTKCSSQTINILKNAVYWDVTPCGFIRNQRFGETCRLHLEGRRKNNASEEKTSNSFPRSRHCRENIISYINILYTSCWRNPEGWLPVVHDEAILIMVAQAVLRLPCLRQ
jgi:hypothetical protein